MSETFRIANREVGGTAACFVIGEIAQTHDGSLGTAHAYIDAIARTGATAIKFQTHIAAGESTPGEPFRVKFSRQDASRYEYWKRMEFTEAQWRGLAEHAAEVGLVFLSSPFSFEAVDLLERIGVAAWKIGAGEVTNIPLLEKIAATRKPVLLSSGLSTWDDLDHAVATIRSGGASVALFQTTTAYPCPPEKLGLNVLAQLRDRYGAPVGLSDHSATIFAGIAAVSLGAKLLEVHVAFTRECFGPDVVASITVDELATMMKGIRFIESALANPVDKDAMAAQLSDLKQLFGKSIVAARDLPQGHRLAVEDFAYKKPGTGILAARRDELLGRSLRRSITADTQLSEDDFE